MSTSALAWGNIGHEVVNTTAADLMTSPGAHFFRTNKQALAKLANTPDGPWKKPPHFEDERPTHFFQWDRYRGTPIAQGFDSYLLDQVIQRLGKDYVKENGSALWRVSGLMRKLVDALRQKDWKRSLQMAGVLGHYAGDLSQPMHITSDYDGQSIGRSGVHRYFETTLVQKVARNDLVTGAQRDGGTLLPELDQIRREGDALRHARALALHEGIAAYEDLEPVLDQFEPNSQNDASLKKFFGPRLGGGAALLAKLWDLAITEAGVEDGFPTAALNVPEPEWIPLAD